LGFIVFPNQEHLPNGNLLITAVLKQSKVLQIDKHSMPSLMIIDILRTTVYTCLLLCICQY